MRFCFTDFYEDWRQNLESNRAVIRACLSSSGNSKNQKKKKKKKKYNVVRKIYAGSISNGVTKKKKRIAMFRVSLHPSLKSLVIPVIWLALIDTIYSRIAPIFCFKSHLFPSHWGGYTKNKTTIQISRLV